MQLIGIKYLNALIDNKPFFLQPGKIKQEAYEKLMETSRNNDYTTGKLLDYLYDQKYYKLIGIDLSTNYFCIKIRRKRWCNNAFYC